MTPITYTYTFDNQKTTISGFIASLLLQGDQWDYRCQDADIQDYHLQQYARMDSREALIQEINWWLDAYENELFKTHIEFNQLLNEGIYYLFDCARKILTPYSDTDKLTTDMIICLERDIFLGKSDDEFIFNDLEADKLIHGFPAQLLSYAACTTVESMMQSPYLKDPVQWVNIILDWLDSPPTIYLHHIQFHIPNVYALYTCYLDEEKRKWESICQVRYQQRQPQFRTFMASLIQEAQNEANLAMKLLSPYLSEKQRNAYLYYLEECQRYLSDQSQTKSKGRTYSLDKYWCPGIEDYVKQTAIRKLKTAVKKEHPAAALALEVKRLQRDGILIKELRPLTHFVAAVNKVCNSNIKHDSFSKHFR